MEFVLLRGLTRDSRHWWEVPDLLRASWPGARILTLDSPGTGSRCRERCPTQISQITDRIRESWLSQNPSNGTRVLVGVSLGAMIALDWVSRYPQDFHGVMVTNTSARNLGSTHDRFSFYNLPRILRAVIGNRGSFIEPMILHFTVRDPRSHAFRLPQLIRWRETHPVSRGTFIAQLRAAMGFRAPDRLAIRVSVVVSEGDRLVSPRCSRELAKRLGVKPIVHPSAGHDLPLDEPKWFADQIAAFARGAGFS